MHKTKPGFLTGTEKKEAVKNHKNREAPVGEAWCGQQEGTKGPGKG